MASSCLPRRRWLLGAIASLGASVWLFPIGPSVAQQPRDVVVFAAASLKNALDDIKTQYERDTGKHVTISYAASSTLAKQIEAAAPADIFISADLDWMDYLAKKNLIKAETRANLLGNQLVLIAPSSSTIELGIVPNFPLAQALGNGRLAVADPNGVPAGKYGKASLQALGIWSSVAGNGANGGMAPSVTGRGDRGAPQLARRALGDDGEPDPGRSRGAGAGTRTVLGKCVARRGGSPAAGHATGGDRLPAAAAARPPRPARPVPRRAFRDRVRLSLDWCRTRLRSDGLSADGARDPPVDRGGRPPAGGCCGHTRRRPGLGLSGDHPAAGSPRHHRRHDPLLCAQHGRVRRHDYLRREHPGRDPDPPLGDLHPDPNPRWRRRRSPPDRDIYRDFHAGIAGCRIPCPPAQPHSSRNLMLAGDRTTPRRRMRFRCGRRFRGPFAGRFEVAQPRGSRGMRLGLDRAVQVDRSRAEGRKGGAAAAAAARSGGDRRFTKAVVHVVDQKPGPAMGHAEPDAGLSDRSGVADRLQQANLSRADRPFVAKIDVQVSRAVATLGGSLPPRLSTPIETGIW